MSCNSELLENQKKTFWYFFFCCCWFLSQNNAQPRARNRISLKIKRIDFYYPNNLLFLFLSENKFFYRRTYPLDFNLIELFFLLFFFCSWESALHWEAIKKLSKNNFNIGNSSIDLKKRQSLYHVWP